MRLYRVDGAFDRTRAEQGGEGDDAEAGLGMAGGEDEEELEVERGTVSFGEHAFQFEKFEQVSGVSGTA